MSFATVHGSPGARVRFLGLSAIYWPALVAVFLCGWFLHALFPLGMPRWAAALALLALAGAAWAASDRCARRFGRFLKGAQGEEAVARELALLPAGWTVLHGIPRTGAEALRGGGDFDHVALGARSVFVIETKNWSGPVRIEDAVFVAGGVRVPRSPVVQARREAIELARALRGVLPEGAAVRPLVCFAGNGLEEDRTAVDDTPVCNVRALLDVLRERDAGADGPPLGETVRDRIVAALLARR